MLISGRRSPGGLIDSIEQIMVDPSATAPVARSTPCPTERQRGLSSNGLGRRIISVKAVTVFPDNGAQD